MCGFLLQRTALAVPPNELRKAKPQTKKLSYEGVICSRHFLGA